MKLTAAVLWLLALALLLVRGWVALFTEESLWGYPYLRVVGAASVTGATLSVGASFLFDKARRERTR